VHKIPIGVLGASGYAGRELCLLAERHPGMDLVFATAYGQRGQSVRVGGRDMTFLATEDARLEDAELVFSALPHGTSGEWVMRAQSAGSMVVDLSADFRSGNGDPSQTSSIPYGLTELMRDRVRTARVVANPGCYPTAILLALAPLITGGLIEPGSAVTIAAASGVTGAGHSPRPDLLFAEVSEDFRAYAVNNDHRHLAEMNAVVKDLGGDADLIFTPHLLPVARGILATIVVRLRQPLNDPLSVWSSAYAAEPFIEVASATPSIRDVVRRNVVRISATVAANVRQPTLIVTAAIDNLMKGAAGQAVQNANVMLGLDETMGLPA